MGPSRLLTSARVARIASLLPVSLLAATEKAARLGQGKGWGTATTAAEVAACLSLISGSGRNLVALDIGANVGDWTAELKLRRPDSTVWVFEPAVEAHTQLALRFRGDKSVHVVRSAIGSADGEVDLWADHPGSGLASLSRRRLDHVGIAMDVKERVPVTTLDGFCGSRGIQPDIIKIDVEGHEMDVLEGAREALKSTSVVQFEMGGTNIDTKVFFQDFFYFFRERGFEIRRLTPRGLQPVKSYSEFDEAFVATNYVALRLGI